MGTIERDDDFLQAVKSNLLKKKEEKKEKKLASSDWNKSVSEVKITLSANISKTMINVKVYNRSTRFHLKFYSRIQLHPYERKITSETSRKPGY